MTESSLSDDSIVLIVANALDKEAGSYDEDAAPSSLALRLARAALFDLAQAGYSVLTPAQADDLRDKIASK